MADELQHFKNLELPSENMHMANQFVKPEILIYVASRYRTPIHN